MTVDVYESRPHTARDLFWRPGIYACFPAVLYLLLSIGDLCFSLVAFRYGVAEGNPFMAWLVSHDVFIPGKLAMSIVVSALMAVIYNAPGRFRWIVWTGVAVMVLLDAYHLWALPHVLGLPGLASAL